MFWTDADRPRGKSKTRECGFRPLAGGAPFGGSELHHNANLRVRSGLREKGETTSKLQKLLRRLIVPVSICGSIPLWPAAPKQGVIGEQLGLIVPLAAQAAVTVDRSIRDYKLPSEIPWSNGMALGVLRSTATRQSPAEFMFRS